MNDIEVSRDRIVQAWPTMSERDRRFVLAVLEALADRMEPAGPGLPLRDLVATDPEGRTYTNFRPIPCEDRAELLLDAAGTPYCLSIDRTAYALRPAPRLKIRGGGGTLITLGRRLPPST